MASVRAMNIALQRHTCRCANLAECRCAAVTKLGFMVACVAVLWCMMSWNFPMKLPHDEWLSDHFGSAKRSNWKQRHQNHHKIITNLKRKLTTLNWRRIQGTPALNALCRPWIWTSCRKHLRSFGLSFGKMQTIREKNAANIHLYVNCKSWARATCVAAIFMTSTNVIAKISSSKSIKLPVVFQWDLLHCSTQNFTSSLPPEWQG